MRSCLVTVGPIATNCYLVFLEDVKRLYIIDPGCEPERILHETSRYPEAESVRILLTHAHVDHISAAGAVAEALGVDKVMLDPDDLEIYNSPYNEILPYMPAPEDPPPTTNFDTEGLFTVLKVPGHTPGGCAFFFEHGGSRALFGGDTLFYGSIGRTDLPGGDHGTLIDSIKTQLLTLPRLTPVFPGHGEATTIGRELVGNPYLK